MRKRDSMHLRNITAMVMVLAVVGSNGPSTFVERWNGGKSQWAKKEHQRKEEDERRWQTCELLTKKGSNPSSGAIVHHVRARSSHSDLQGCRSVERSIPSIPVQTLKSGYWRAASIPSQTLISKQFSQWASGGLDAHSHLSSLGLDHLPAYI